MNSNEEIRHVEMGFLFIYFVRVYLNFFSCLTMFEILDEIGSSRD